MRNNLPTMVLAIVVYTSGAALFYAWLTRSAVLVDEPHAAATHPVQATEMIDLFPAESERKAA